MSAAPKIKEIVEENVRQFVSTLDEKQKSEVLDWSQKALAIRNSDLPRKKKIAALSKIENGEVARIVLLKIFEILKGKVWTNQSWARRLGFAGFATGITFGGSAVGIATMGAGIGVPLMLMTAAGGVVLGSAIDEIKKELASKGTKEVAEGSTKD